MIIKHPRISFIILLLILLGFSQEMTAQKGIEGLSRTGTLRMLHQLDSLVNDYNSFCSFKGTSLSNISEFKNLFTSGEVMVFDDINPNILSDSLNQIRETYKTLEDYMYDIENDFMFYSASLMYDDAASAAERLYRSGNQLFLTVSLIKFGEGTLKDSIKCKSISTEAGLEVWIKLKDTINFDMKIDRILKKGPFSVDWKYTLAEVDKRKMEMHLNLRPVYSYLRPHSFKPEDVPNRVVINDNQRLGGETLEDLGLASNCNWGSVGINGDLEFRFIWDKEAKAKTKGFSIGLGAGLYNSYFKADYYYEVIESTDKDEIPYYAISGIDDLRDTWTLFTADIPLKFSSEKWTSHNKGRYFNLGSRLSYVMGYGRGKGTISRNGYYPEYGIFFEDIPDYDFVKEVPLKESYSPNIGPLNVSVEMNFGRKHRSNNGKLVFYTGVSMGAYVLDFLEPNSNRDLIGPKLEYNGMLPLMENGRMAYIGIDLGLTFADPNEEILKRKRIVRSEVYGGSENMGYSRVHLKGVESRREDMRRAFDFAKLNKSEQPVLFGSTSQDPLKLLDDFISDRLKVSETEKVRIKSQKDFTVYFSFEIDHTGALRKLSFFNQKDTELGLAIREILLKTNSFWDPGTKEGTAITTRITSKYEY